MGLITHPHTSHNQSNWGIIEAMAYDARVLVPTMIHGCPEVFNGLSSLVNVGGDNGTTLKVLVKAFPWLRGINFDQSHVVSVAAVISGVENVGGDMFESVPMADAAFLKVSMVQYIYIYIYIIFNG